MMQCMLIAFFKFAFLVLEIVQNGWYVIIIIINYTELLIIQALS